MDEASLKMFNSPDGSTSRLDVSLEGDPYSEEALTVIYDLSLIHI